jgi:hypothetical protein
MELSSSNFTNTQNKWLNSDDKIQLAAWLASSNEDYIYIYVDLAVSDAEYKTHFKRLKNRERKCMAGNSNLCIEDFAIALSTLPAQHTKLMRVIGWTNCIGDTTKAEGFYAESMAGALAGEIHTCNYITVEKYAELLTIEFKLMGYFDGLNGGCHE